MYDVMPDKKCVTLCSIRFDYFMDVNEREKIIELLRKNEIQVEKRVLHNDFWNKEHVTCAMMSDTYDIYLTKEDEYVVDYIDRSGARRRVHKFN